MLLAEFITAHRDQILQQWEKFAQLISGFAPLPRWILRDHAGTIIDLMARQLANPPAAPTYSLSRTAETASPVEDVTAAHVNIRIASGFDLAQIVSEYCVLRACVVGLWREHAPDSFATGAAELTTFNEIVDSHIRAAVAYYKDHESKYRDRFLGILGHDLRNPINAIVLAAAALAEQGLNQQQLKTLTAIQNSSDRLTRMVNDILDFARGRLGLPMPITRTPSHLGLIAHDVVSEVQAAYPGSVVDWQADGDLNGDWDADRLKQVVVNLLTNAIQHGTGDRVSLTVKSDERFVILEVRNQGPPIPAELLPSMFDPLVRGSSASRNQQGLGLGLFIADQIVSAHKGTIAVTSSQDDGTTFVVRLPRR